MKQTFNGADLRSMMLSAAANVENHKQKLNDLNVFPVPDGDTGTNMSMTINAAARELRSVANPTVESVSATAASAMLRGARGNSGVILSLLFRGLAKRLKGVEECDGVIWAEALQAGVDAAYKAVMKPAEGTILTVSRLAAAAAKEAAEKKNNVEYVHKAAIAAAKKALANTMNQNPVLKKAGVVDAGGKGWVYVLIAMHSSMQGEDITVKEPAEGSAKEQANFGDISDEEITFTYCTEFIINRENKKKPSTLRAFLDGIGDSLVVVDDDEIIKVHVHTNDPGRALHEAIEYGSLATVKIENMRLQHTEKVMSEKEKKKELVAKPKKPLGVVAVCAGDGLSNVFKDLGVDGIISGGQTMNPSTQDILKVVNKVPAETVFVLPNNKNIIMAAEQVNALTPKNVVVIPSKTVPQGVTAMLSFNPDGSVEDNTEALTEALGAVDTMQITYAARNSDFDGHNIKEGDYLAIYGSALFGTSRDIKVLFKALAEKVKSSGKEYITIYYGADIKERQAQRMATLFREICPNADVNLLYGGQPVYYYLISAE